MFKAMLAVGLCLVAGVASGQLVEGPPIDANNPPAAMRVIYGGQTKDLPLVENNLVIPPWWIPSRASEWPGPATSGQILRYQTPNNDPVRWSIDVIRRGGSEDRMNFGIYDGTWRAWSTYRFRPSSQSGVISIQPL